MTPTGKAPDRTGAQSARTIHPFAALGDAPGPTIAAAVDACRIRDSDGKTYLDAAAGLANVNLGYQCGPLLQAAAAAFTELPFATLFFGRRHAPAEALTERLAEVTPPGIRTFHYTVGGSDANETAIKLARKYFTARGEQDRTVIIGRTKGYHGTSLGALSATGQPPLWEGYGPLVGGFAHVDQPTVAADPIAQLEETILRLGPERVAAFIAEPVSLPAGVAVPPPDYWPHIRALCDRFGILLILDEVICGFGRTGPLFAAEHWGLVPDILSMSKGITGGYFPLGAVGVNDRVADELLDSAGMFLHGFTGGGHPVACSMALVAIDQLARDELAAHVGEIGGYLRDRLDDLGASTGALSPSRGLGLLNAVDVVADRAESEPFSADAHMGDRVGAALQDAGVLVRQFGETLAFAPPLVIERSDIDEIVECLAGVLEEVVRPEREVALAQRGTA